MHCCAEDERRVHTNVAVDCHPAFASTCGSWMRHAGARVTVLRSAHDCWFPDWQAEQIAHAAPHCQAQPASCVAHPTPFIPQTPKAHPLYYLLGCGSSCWTLPGPPIRLACPAVEVLVDRTAPAATLGPASFWLLVSLQHGG